ncbi:MAG: glycosyltransferase [Candidatus Parcubacteria bacterium]|nr:glycosyltransferase [Candidatus Parcubacteria bacterium]
MKILIVLPSYNEAKILEANVSSLIEFVRINLAGQQFKIVISDNNSKDNTREVAEKLKAKYPEVAYGFIGEQGKGYAISRIWEKGRGNFDIFIFMDTDLATDLQALPDLIKGIQDGYDLVIGSRYLKESQVKRSVWRRLFSLGYRCLLRLVLGTQIRDLPCGFKAGSPRVVKEIMPQVQNHTWFFDSELVYLAEKAGLKIKEIPVKWQEPRGKEDKSRVNMLKVTALYFNEVWRLRKQCKK